MFRRKTANEAPSPSTQAAPPRMNAGGYETIELPTFHGRKRKVVVYTSDASGKIIKTFKH